MKVFISQPMRGKNKEEIFEVRDAIINYLNKIYSENIEIVDSYIENSEKSQLWLLGEAIKKLSTADLMFLAPGWTFSRGCIIEELAATTYGIPIINGETLDKEN